MINSKDVRRYGVTYFLNEELWAVIIEKRGDESRILERISVSLEGEKTEQDLTDFQNGINRYSNNSVIWIHLIMRCSGLVRTFGLPEDLPGPVEGVLRSRVTQEIPHLVDEIIYHARVQQGRGGNSQQGLMFGVPKNVLNEQHRNLERFSICPDQFMLSTEVLTWYHAHETAELTGHEQPVFLKAHSAGGQGELLYLKGESVLHSQSLKTEFDSAHGLKEAILTANESLRKNIGVLPAKTILDEDNSLLFYAAAEAYQSRAVFDFSPSELEVLRTQKAFQTVKKRLWRMLALCSLCLLIFASAQVVSTGLQLAWVNIKSGVLAGAVSETKALKREAVSVRKFQSKKTAPVLLIDALQNSVPAGLIFSDLEFDSKNGKFFLRGQAGRKDLDEYLTALQAEKKLEVTLDRVEALADNAGSVSFELNGTFNAGAEQK